MGYRDMLGRGEVVTVDEARRIFYNSYSPPEPETEEVQLADALGRVLAKDIVPDSPLPEFPRSSMDGYAVFAADTFGASESLPAYLKLTGEIRMGEPASIPLTRGQVFKISTGGMLPAGADAVVMFEHTQALGKDIPHPPVRTAEAGAPAGPPSHTGGEGYEVEILKPVAPGENVVQPGDDIRAGETILAKGRRLRPQDLGALAGIGVVNVPVFKMPKVAIINTGNEIVPADNKPLPGQVRDVNSYNLAGLVRQAGGIPMLKGIFRDDYGQIRGAVEDALSDCDIVALTGGSSVGTGDLTAKVINDAGTPGVLVHGVSVRPGKPIIIGVAKGKPIFGLPGHPVAVTVSFELFLGPLIKKVAGEVDTLGIAGIPNIRAVEAKMARNYSSAPGREDHLRVWLKSEGGEIWAHPVLGKSGLISTLVKAHGTVVVPLEKPGIAKGEKVTVRLFD